METPEFRPTSRNDITPNHYEMARGFNSLYVDILEVSGIFDDVRQGNNTDLADLVGMFRQAELGESPSKANEWVWDEAVIPGSRFELERSSGTILTDIVAPLFTQAVWASAERGEIDKLEELFAVQIAIAGSFVEAQEAKVKSTRQQFATRIAELLNEQAYYKALPLRVNEDSRRHNFAQATEVMAEVGIELTLPNEIASAQTERSGFMRWMSRMHPHGFREGGADDPNSGATV